MNPNFGTVCYTEVCLPQLAKFTINSVPISSFSLCGVNREYIYYLVYNHKCIHTTIKYMSEKWLDRAASSYILSKKYKSNQTVVLGRSFLNSIYKDIPPVDLHLFFEISILAFISNWDKNSVIN